MPQIELTLDRELYDDVKKIAAKLRLPPRMFLRALIAAVMEEARQSDRNCAEGQEPKQEVAE